MILYGFLEHFLHRARAAWRENDTAESNRQNGVFPNTVVKIFCDIGSEGCRRFMPVKPCGNAQTVIFLLWE